MKEIFILGRFYQEEISSLIDLTAYSNESSGTCIIVVNTESPLEFGWR